MPEERPLLQQALEVVSEEQAELRREIEAFSRFRDTVSHTYPSETDVKASNPTADLVEEYEETVLATSDSTTVADVTLEQSLRRELSKGIADAFLTRAPYSNQMKRKLLVQSSTAIDQRQLFHQALEAEEDALETAAAELRDIAAKTEALPKCSVQETHLEELLETWEAYDDLEDECQRVITQRQRQLGEPERRLSIRGEEHALCRYLFGHLETTYPVFSAVARACEQIDAARRGSTRSRPPVQSSHFP